MGNTAPTSGTAPSQKQPDRQPLLHRSANEELASASQVGPPLLLRAPSPCSLQPATRAVKTVSSAAVIPPLDRACPDPCSRHCPDGMLPTESYGVDRGQVLVIVQEDPSNSGLCPVATCCPRTPMPSGPIATRFIAPKFPTLPVSTLQSRPSLPPGPAPERRLGPSSHVDAASRSTRSPSSHLFSSPLPFCPTAVQTMQHGATWSCVESPMSKSAANHRPTRHDRICGRRRIKFVGRVTGSSESSHVLALMPETSVPTSGPVK